MKTKNQIKCKALLAVCCMAAVATLMLASCGKEKGNAKVSDVIVSDCLYNIKSTKSPSYNPLGSYSFTCVGNDVHVQRYNLPLDCNFDSMFVELSYNEDTIKVDETPYPEGGGTNCICAYNVSYWLRGLPSGQHVLAFFCGNNWYYDTIINLP